MKDASRKLMHLARSIFDRVLEEIEKACKALPGTIEKRMEALKLRYESNHSRLLEESRQRLERTRRTITTHASYEARLERMKTRERLTAAVCGRLERKALERWRSTEGRLELCLAYARAAVDRIRSSPAWRPETEQTFVVRVPAEAADVTSRLRERLEADSKGDCSFDVSDDGEFREHGVEVRTGDGRLRCVDTVERRIQAIQDEVLHYVAGIEKEIGGVSNDSAGE